MAIGTTAALLGSAAIGAGASIISGNKAAKAQASGADASAQAQLLGTEMTIDAQKEALDKQLKYGREGRALQQDYLNKSLRLAKNERDFQRRKYNTQQRQLSSIREAGGNALNALRYEMGMGDKPGWYEGYSMSPMAQYALSEGRDQIEAGAAASGSLMSGATLQALDDRRATIVNADRGEFYDRLTGMAANRQNAIMGMGAAPSSTGPQNVLGQMAGVTGQNTASTQSLLGNYASNVGNAYQTGYGGVANARMAGGQAQAGAIANTGNSFNNFLGQAASIYGYSQGGGFGMPGMGAGFGPAASGGFNPSFF